MEQKRTLWIIAAVGVFLLVVLGAAVILYAPSSNSAQSIASTESAGSKGSSGWISLAPQSAPVPDPHGFENGNVPEVSGENNMPVPPPEFHPERGEQVLPPPEESYHTDEVVVYTDNVTIQANQVNNKAASSEEKIPEVKVQPVKESSVKAKTVPAPKTASVKPVSKPAVKAKAPAQPKTVQVKKPEITQFWVQVSALTSRKSADSAREILASNKINAEVFTYEDAKGKLFFRVRVGPYTTKSEAEYWKNRIDSIDNFKNTQSYVAAAKVTQ